MTKTMQTPSRWQRWAHHGLVAVLLVLIGAGCQTVRTTGAGVVGVDREQMMLVSASEVEQASAKQYAQVLAEARKQGVLNPDRRQTARVQAIVNRLVAHAPAFRPDARNWRWQVAVIDVDELNAWCMAGGKMAIYTGLIDRLSLTDDEIAAVMGHEIAHALREHARERISKSMATGLGVSIAGALLGVGQVGTDLMNQVAHVTFSLPNSRLHETEADRIGVELAARAGFDPRAAITLWGKMARASGGQPPQWLSTHPSHENRTRDLARYAERVLPLYQGR